MMKNKNIKIKGQKYTLKLVDDIDGESCGLSDCINKIIYIKIDKNKKNMISTFVHELYHCYFHECGLVELEGNEMLVYWLEKHFFDIDIETFNFVDDLECL